MVEIKRVLLVILSVLLGFTFLGCESSAPVASENIFVAGLATSETTFSPYGGFNVLSYHVKLLIQNNTSEPFTFAWIEVIFEINGYGSVIDSYSKDGKGFLVDAGEIKDFDFSVAFEELLPYLEHTEDQVLFHVRIFEDKDHLLANSELIACLPPISQLPTYEETLVPNPKTLGYQLEFEAVQLMEIKTT